MPASTQHPNVLWLMSDEQRTDSLGCYGSRWAHSPHLDRLAREGAIFQTAVTSAPVCAPARASLVTGQYPHETGIWWNIPKPYPELSYLTDHFHEAGYESAAFGKRHYSGARDAFQTEHHFEVADAVDWFHYAEPYDPAAYDVVQYPREPFGWILGGRFPEAASRKSEARAVSEAMDWLEGRESQAPFLLHLSFNAPHTPVVPPPPYDTLIKESAITYPPEVEVAPPDEPRWLTEGVRPRADARRLTTEQIRKARRYYYGEAAFLDSQIGRLLEYMQARGLLDNTIIAFVSDHGTHIGDYGLVQKQSFYEPVVNVPFLLWHPKSIRKGGRFTTPVETRSLLPTLLELAGLTVPEAVKRTSLAPALVEGREPAAGPVFSEFTLGTFRIRHDDRLVMVRDGDWKLSLCLDPEPGDGALYHLSDDPFERRNLYGNPGAREAQERLTGLILRHVGSWSGEA
jgi:arylsulfatase